MAKQDVNKNFEKLKEEMMKKKVTATSLQESTIENVNVIIDDDIIDDVSDDKIVNIYENKSDLQDLNTSIESNKIVIKKAKKAQPPKRTTYYLNQETIKKIDRYSKLTGMGKSELVQTLLDVALNNLEVTN